MKQTVATKPQNASEDIARRAYGIWESKGRPQGCDMECWLEAENEVKSQQVAGGPNNGKTGGRRSAIR